MSVPILTIPEEAFNPASYTRSRRNDSSLLRFLIQLTRGSALALVVAYILGLLALRPLMELTSSQRLDFLEECRARLTALYLNAASRVNFIPIVAITKPGRPGKVYADALCQTDDVKENDHKVSPIETLGADTILEKLQKLSAGLAKCTSHTIDEMPHYKLTDLALKDFQSKSDLVYFNQRNLFVDQDKKNLVHNVRSEIRAIKGMYMSGQA